MRNVSYPVRGVLGRARPAVSDKLYISNHGECARTSALQYKLVFARRMIINPVPAGIEEVALRQFGRFLLRCAVKHGGVPRGSLL